MKNNRKAKFYNMAIFPLDNLILLRGVWAWDLIYKLGGKDE
jgi:hypothetical protein